MYDKIWFPLSITLWIATISSLLVLFSGIVIVYIFVICDFRGKELEELFVTLPLILPITVTGYLLVILIGRNGFIGQLIYNFFDFRLKITKITIILILQMLPAQLTKGPESKLNLNFLDTTNLTAEVPAQFADSINLHAGDL